MLITLAYWSIRFIHNSLALPQKIKKLSGASEDFPSNDISADCELINKKIEIYDTTGAVGAARAALINGNDFGAFKDFL